MTMPVRVQLRRTKGWRMPPNTVKVTRPGPHGNPFYPGCGRAYGSIDGQGRLLPWPLETRADAVRHFREHLCVMRKEDPERFRRLIEPLKGKNVACWCKLTEPCHGDVWLEFAAEAAALRETAA